jgi:hypothetical protein
MVRDETEERDKTNGKREQEKMDDRWNGTERIDDDDPT